MSWESYLEENISHLGMSSAHEKNTHMAGVYKRGRVREITIEQLGRPSKGTEYDAHERG